MIEKMKTVTLVCLKKDQAAALETLRGLELMHVKPVAFQASRKLADVQRELDSLTRIINMLAQKEPADQTPPEMPAEKLFETIREVNHRMTRAHDEWEQLARIEEQLEPWGAFDPNLLKEIRDSGLDLRLCQASASKLPELPAGVILHEINRILDQVYFAVVSREPLEMELPEVNLSLDRSLTEVRARKKELSEIIRSADAELATLAHAMPALEKHKTELLDDEEFLTAMERMNTEQRLVTLTGYIPVKRTGQLKENAMEHGWAYRLSDPAPDDLDVPTLISTPRWLRVSKPLFDFVGITPDTGNSISVHGS
ncbi:MAG TPA: hypothetical protein PLV45_05045 [bacterium]|nr:hypothetical protein [bacterium]